MITLTNTYLRFCFYTLAFAMLLTACEDPIDVPSQFETPQLVVDAWLTNTDRPQTIRLSQSIDYFGGGEVPTVDDASVSICNGATADCYTFNPQGRGEYVWTPMADQTFGQVGDALTLTISSQGQAYESTESIGRTARLDSISLEFEEQSIGFDEGLYAQAYAFDLPGRGDSYWMRAYKNDTLLNRPLEQTIAYDATFDAGADIDGTYFITPLRFGINALDDDGAFIPYVAGDSIYVEVHSINEAAFRFLSIAVEQITNEGIFASPLANAKSNVFNSATNEPVLGIFNIAEVASLGRRVE
jgi:hypothetical protein